MTNGLDKRGEGWYPPPSKKKGGFIMKKRKDRNGRVLPDGVSLRVDGRYIYRYRLHGKQKYLYSNDLQELKSKIEELKIDVASGANIDLKNMSTSDIIIVIGVVIIGIVLGPTIKKIKRKIKKYTK